MKNSLAEIPELANYRSGRGLIRIPMEQDVPFTPRVRAIVDTAEFQRLRQVTQLGLASKIYPGATHTRFEHALGVFLNAVRYLIQLTHDPRFSAVIDRHHAEVLMVSALLHDLGHWPYCHPIEDLNLPNMPQHEEFAGSFLQPDSELTRVLKSHWDIKPEEVLDVLVARTDSPQLRLIRSILSGPIDIDKMDYLDRDSLHAGVPYGRNFDRNRLIQSLMVNETGDGLAVSEKGKTATELMVFARYVMFSEVYWHHAVRASTCMFGRAFQELYQQWDLNWLFHQSESDMVQELRRAAEGKPVAKLLEGIFGNRRSIYKRVGEYSLVQSAELYQQLSGKRHDYLEQVVRKLAEVLTSRAGVEFDPFDLLIDAPPADREVEFKVQIYYAKEDVYRYLHDVSPVIESLAQRQFDDYVKRVRIFVNPHKRSHVPDQPELTQILLDIV
ncbi:HD domain protein [Polystyrenella longa]|uniref:HD domain protein n=1 Tax=Polystyrenella longa TaxID=2528007 RepID=A0A518CPZ0_9PLAN|nr:HD domain-containing protein [Polystyrenella longa]QDU81287.1 HD domain protein [Polystyrenella longa]